MQIRSRLATLTITAALAAGMLTALGMAVPASAAARAQVTLSTSDPDIFGSVGNYEEFIQGDTHGGDLYLGSLVGTLYTPISEGNGWYELKGGSNCWNAYPKATKPIGEDSCQGTDHNEWWKAVPYKGYDKIEQDSSGLIATAVDGEIDLDAGGGPAGDYEWQIYS
jgi:hypothetical protein